MASLFAYLSYRDAPAAIDWLKAIGFQVVTRQPADDGPVLHPELSLEAVDAGTTGVLGGGASALNPAGYVATRFDFSSSGGGGGGHACSDFHCPSLCVYRVGWPKPVGPRW